MPDPDIEHTSKGKPVCDLCGKDDGVVQVFQQGPILAAHMGCMGIANKAVKNWAHFIANHPYGFRMLLTFMSKELDE